MTINDYYETHDLSIAAAIALFYPLDFIDKSNPRKAIFQFRRQEGLDKLIQAIWTSELKIPPLAYFAQLKQLKTQLYSED